MATAQTVRPEQAHHYLWWFPGSPVRVRLDLGVVQELKNRLFGPNAEPARPEEGLLFGEIRNGATAILDFEPATPENVRSLVEMLPSEKKGSLVGYYRTESSESFKLNAQDHSLARDHFARPYSVFLLVHRNSFGPPTATFFFHDSDCRMADFAFMEFPFDPVLLASEQDGRTRRTVQAHPIAVVPAQPPASSAVAAQPPRTKPNSILKSLVWTCSLASAVALTVSFSSGSVRQRSSNVWQAVASTLSKTSGAYSAAKSDSRPLLSLRAIKQSGFLALTWDRDSPLIAAAASGILSIRDGDSTRVISCDAAQLRDGSLLYVPETDQISMQLTVTTPIRTYKESVTVILPRAAERLAVPSLPRAPAGPPASFRAPSGGVSPSSPDLPDHSAILAAIPIIEEPAPDQSAHPAQTLPSQPSAEPAKYKPAVAILKVQPKLPAELQSLLVQKTTVEVNVTIDKTGRVIQAEAIPPKPLNHSLLNSVVNASMLWKFKPALRNNQPVTSESILEFVFDP
jgi:DNA-directed RNA polymerase subunit F